MIKKLFTGLLTFIILVSITTFSVLITLRQFLSGNNISSIIIAQSDKIVDENTFNDIVEESNIKPEDEEQLKEYLDGAYEVAGYYVSDYLKYASGVSKTKPNTDEIREYLYKISDEYEEKTGNKIDDEYIESVADELENELDQDAEKNIFNNEEKTIFQIIYSNKIIIILLIIIIVSLLLIYLINKKLRTVAKCVMTSSIINGISLFLLALALNGIISTMNNEVATSIVQLSSKYIYINGLISICVAIVLIVILILTKKKKLKNEK